MSTLNINGVNHPDGAPLVVNGVQAGDVKANGTSVWVNTQIPSAITDFLASDNQVNQITITFTPATGIPDPVHALYEDGVLVADGVTSGFVYVRGSAYVGTYKVVATNSVGSTDSNTDPGSATAAAGSVTFNATANWVVPVGITSAFVCGCGGGGGGTNGRGPGGGGSGTGSELAVSLLPGENVNIAIGQGGAVGAGLDDGFTGDSSVVSGAGIAPDVTYAGGGGTIGGTPGIGVNGGGDGAIGDPAESSDPSSGCGGNYPGTAKTNNNHGGAGGAGGYGSSIPPSSTAQPPNLGCGGGGGHINFDFPGQAGSSGKVIIRWNDQTG